MTGQSRECGANQGLLDGEYTGNEEVTGQTPGLRAEWRVY